MKHILLCVLALALCALAGSGITAVICRRRPMRTGIRVLLGAGITLLLLVLASLGYLEAYYHADPSVDSDLISTREVEVMRTENGYRFDGPGEGSAVIFYPGGKVEATAYAPLLFQLAREGEDCFLVEMPFRLPILRADAADALLAGYDYGTWYLMGHSLGGLTAAGYAAENGDRIDGLILLAAYPLKALPDSVPLLSLYGSEDGCLDPIAYEKGKTLWPSEAGEVVLTGANHAQFGCYGVQRGDGTATISAGEQQQAAIDVILAWIGDR